MSDSQRQNFWASSLGQRVLDTEQIALETQLRRLRNSSAHCGGETSTPLSLLKSCMVRQGVCH